MSAVHNQPILNETQVLHDIEEMQVAIFKDVRSAKVNSIRIGYSYSRLAGHCFYFLNCSDKAYAYSKKALEYFQKYPDFAWKDPDLTYLNWSRIFTECALQMKIDPNIECIFQGLEAVNSALAIYDKMDAIYHKFIFLKALEEQGVATSESFLEWLRLYLGRYPDRCSEEYKIFSRLYSEQTRIYKAMLEQKDLLG